jgi:hypothetical protein
MMENLALRTKTKISNNMLGSDFINLIAEN